MPVPNNRGKEINRSNTGPGDAILKPHGNFRTSRHGQVVEGLDFSGIVEVAHDDVTFRRCRGSKSLWQDPASTVRKGIRLEYCEFGAMLGYDDNEENSGGGIRLGNFVMIGTQVYGFIDLIHPWGGHNVIFESFLFGPYHDLESRHQGGGDAHCDMVQGPGNNPIGWDSMLIQDSRFDAFPFEKGGKATDQNMSKKPATSGCINMEYGSMKNTTIRGNLLDGNYSQLFYVLNQDGQGGPPTNTAIFHNIIRRRNGRARYGSISLLNAGGTAGRSTVQWGDNWDYDTGEKIPPMYKTDSSNGNIVPLKALTEYPDFTHDGPRPEPKPEPEPTPITLMPIPDVIIEPVNVTADKGTDPSDYALIYMKGPDGETRLLDKDKIDTMSVTISPLDYPAGYYDLWVEGEQSGKQSPTVRVHIGLVPKPEEPKPDDMIQVPRTLITELRADLTAIRNNSRSTEGDPWKRLAGNVGRADIALNRLPS